MPVTLPYDLTVPSKREIRSSELMGNYNALASKFQASIVDGDCADAMDLRGDKIRVNSIPANRLIDGSVTQIQLAASSVGTSQLVPLAVTAEKLSSVALDKLLVTVHEVAFSVFVATTYGVNAANPTATFDKATYQLLAVYCKNVTSAGSNPSAFGYASDSGANWAGSVAAFLSSGGPQTVTGTLVYVFVKRTV